MLAWAEAFRWAYMEEALRRGELDAGLTLAKSLIACYFDAVQPRGDAVRTDSF